MARFVLVGLAFDAAAARLDPFSADFAWALASSAARAQAVQVAIAWAQSIRAEVVVFSGFTQAGLLDAPAGSPIATQLRTAGLTGVFELVERGASKTLNDLRRSYFVFDETGRLVRGPLQQWIVESGQASVGPVTALLREFAPGGSRRMTIVGVDAALLVYGDDNILKQPRGQPVRDRHPSAGTLRRDYDLLLNPRHTVSRRHETRARIEHFSAGAPHRVAAAHANVGPGQEDSAHLVFVARGGQMAVEGGADPKVHHGAGFYGVCFDVPRYCDRAGVGAVHETR